MKKTGDDELDFIREAGSEVFNYQAKAYYKYALPMQAFCLAIFSGVVALLSTTVALWILTIFGTLLLLQFLLFTGTQLKARHSLKKYTKSQDALNEVTRGFFE